MNRKSSKPSAYKVSFTKDEKNTYLEVFRNKISSDQIIASDLYQIQDALDAHVEEVLHLQIDRDRASVIFNSIRSDLPKLLEKWKKDARKKFSQTDLIDAGLDLENASVVEKIRAYAKLFQNEDRDIRDLIIEAFGKSGDSVNLALLDACLANQKYEIREAQLAQIKNAIAYDGMSFSESYRKIASFILPALEKPEKLELTTYVLMHFIWQIKRKMYRLPIQHHLWPVLFGKQGKGKSSFVRNLCQPFLEHGNHFFESTDFTSLLAERTQLEVIRKYVLFLDEMVDLDKANPEAVKSFITNPTVPIRRYHTQQVNSYFNATTGIGTSNKSGLGQITPWLKRERRFFAIYTRDFVDILSDCETLKDLGHLSDDQMALKKIYPFEGFNAAVFWKMIDESWPCFLPVDKIKESQDASDEPSILESFCLSYNLKPGTDIVAKSQLYDLYLEICKRQGRTNMQVLDVISFDREIRSFLLRRFGERAKGLTVRPKSADYRDITCYRLEISETLRKAIYGTIPRKLKSDQYLS